MDQVKVCTKCREEKFLEDFYALKARKSGVDSQCKACRDSYSKNYRAINSERVRGWEHRTREEQRKEKVGRIALLSAEIDAFKESTPCLDCGNRFPAVCMDFDHITGEKRASVSSLLGCGYSRTAILKEIEKCELVCACCHRIRTHSSGRPRPWDDKKRKYDRKTWDDNS
jgi:hypothetical protein